MVHKNILFTSIGRRNYIINFFRKHFSGRMIATNSIEYTSGMFEADKYYISPKIKSKDYIPFILEICQKENIDIIVPLFDMDLSALCELKQKLNEKGIILFASNKEIIDVCFDKLAYTNYFTSKNIKFPITFDSYDSFYNYIKNNPTKSNWILKPRWGTGSIATELNLKTESIKEYYEIMSDKLRKSYIDNPTHHDALNHIIIQEQIIGIEYGIDIVNDLEGNHVITIPKRKWSMRSGETDVATTELREDLIELGKTLSKELRHIGVLDADIILTESSIPYVIDLNPRFGGGYPFSHEAGLDVPFFLSKWITGQKIDNSMIKIINNLTLAKGISIHKNHND